MEKSLRGIWKRKLAEYFKRWTALITLFFRSTNSSWTMFKSTIVVNRKGTAEAQP